MPSSSPQVILITGCSSGIGRAAAELLLDRGHHVFAAVRRDESVPELTDALARFGDRANVLRLDVTNPADRERAVTDVLSRHNRIDVLINNAGYGQIGAVEELDPDDLHKQYDVNVIGPVDLIRRVLPAMRAARGGRIINVTSVVAHVSTPLMGAYNSSKAALNSLSESLRMELTGTGIDVVLIEPGVIRSSFRDNASSAWRRDASSGVSNYADIYDAWLKRWQRRLSGKITPPAAVARAIVRAVESPRPKPRYRITLAAHIAPWVVALFPDRLTDRLVLRGFGLPAKPKRN